MKQPKPNAKSIRMTDEVFQYINGFEGNGFNEKLQNLVLFCMKTETERRERIQSLDAMIATKSNALYNKLRVMDALLIRCQRGMEGCREILDCYSKDMEAGDSRG